MASNRRQSGFVLAVTLWLLAGIAVAVGLISLWARMQVEQAHVDSERLDDEVAALETRDTLLYVASTREFTLAGLPLKPLGEDELAIRRLDELGGTVLDPVGGELRLDGTLYKGRGSAVFDIQDESGLFSLRAMPGGSIERFLQANGVEAEKIPRLRDTLLDYIDEDDLNRLNGAERRDYERLGRPPPPNRPLLLPSELANVLTWDELPPSRLAAITAQVTVNYAGSVNLNTVPAALLPAWVPNCPQACEAVLARRAQRPLVRASEVEALAGALLPGDAAVDYRFVPSDVMRLDVWGRKGPGQRYHIRLTPLADRRGPWTILAAYPVPRPADDHTAKTTDGAIFAEP